MASTTDPDSDFSSIASSGAEDLTDTDNVIETNDSDSDVSDLELPRPLILPNRAPLSKKFPARRFPHAELPYTEPTIPVEVPAPSEDELSTDEESRDEWSAAEDLSLIARTYARQPREFFDFEELARPTGFPAYFIRDRITRLLVMHDLPIPYEHDLFPLPNALSDTGSEGDHMETPDDEDDNYAVDVSDVADEDTDG